MKKLKAYIDKNRIEVGCDEVGRGCLAGPVVAAAVILNPNKKIVGLDDSKKLSEKKRFFLRDEIQKHCVEYAIGVCSPEEIDQYNILKCSFMAMHKALEQLSEPFTYILVDGNRFIPYKDIAHQTFIKGDGLYQSIAAASIIAKCYRDELMDQLHLEHPAYQWKKNKGYPTFEHRAAIRQIGPCIHHRQSFQLLPVEQLRLFE
jgi:ribonuclease HII